jgi:hypothetical protein
MATKYGTKPSQFLLQIDEVLCHISTPYSSPPPVAPPSIGAIHKVTQLQWFAIISTLVLLSLLRPAVAILSSYAIKSFLIPPFNDVVHGTAEDNFNFFHSSARIAVECAFGEIELRWGILRRPLQCSLAHNCQIIDACMRLHNFIMEAMRWTYLMRNAVGF